MLQTNEEDSIVSVIEEVYWKTGVAPTDALVAEKLSLQESLVQAVRSRPSIQATLRSRGIASETETPHKALTAVQQLAVTIMVNAMDKRSERAKLEDLNVILKTNGLEEVTIHQWAGWKRQPAVQAALSERARQMFSADEWKFHNALVQGTEERNPQIIKMMGQRLGLLSEGSAPVVNVSIDMGDIVEKLFTVLSELITDPDLLVQIGERLEEVMEQPSLPAPIEVIEAPDLSTEKVRQTRETNLAQSIARTIRPTQGRQVESRLKTVSSTPKAGSVSHF